MGEDLDAFTVRVHDWALGASADALHGVCERCDMRALYTTGYHGELFADDRWWIVDGVLDAGACPPMCGGCPVKKALTYLYASSAGIADIPPMDVPEPEDEEIEEES